MKGGVYRMLTLVPGYKIKREENGCLLSWTIFFLSFYNADKDSIRFLIRPRFAHRLKLLPLFH